MERIFLLQNFGREREEDSDGKIERDIYLCICILNKIKIGFTYKCKTSKQL